MRKERPQNGQLVLAKGAQAALQLQIDDLKKTVGFSLNLKGSARERVAMFKGCLQLAENSQVELTVIAKGNNMGVTKLK